MKFVFILTIVFHVHITFQKGQFIATNILVKLLSLTSRKLNNLFQIKALTPLGWNATYRLKNAREKTQVTKNTR